MANTQTEAKRIPALEVETNDYGLTIKFANGKRLMLESSQLTQDIQRIATVHGLKQKLVDAAAISRNAETGRSATVDDKFNAVKDVYDRLLAGAWNAERGEGSGTLLLQALCRLHADKPASDIKEWLAKKSDDEKKALRANPKVAAIVVAIQAERAKVEGIDSDAMLNELN